MTDKKEIQCEYCTVRSNENKCKALKIEFHNCLNILEQKKCPIYKLKQQLQEKEKECEELKREIAFGNNGKLSDKIRAIVFKNLNAENSKYKQALEPFKDDYFKNLDTKTIAELAKKSIRLTTENRKFEDALDEIEENIKAMNNECFYDDICECNNCDMKNGCTYYRKFNILNIINKAKGGVNGNT